MIGSFVFTETSPNAPGTVASSAAVSNVVSSSPLGIATPTDDWDAVDVVAEIAGATGGTLDVYLQVSPDAGQNWYDVIHWPQATAAAAVKYYQTPLSLATTTSTTVQVGKNLNPALAVSTVVNGAFSDRIRLVMVAGASTTAGATVIVRLAPQRPRGSL